MKKNTIPKDRLTLLENRMFRVETLLWVLAGTTGLKLGSEVLPLIAAALFK
jgi:hypothetical protein